MPPIGMFREVNGVRLFVDERGHGGPTVAFLPGAGLTGLDYLRIHERVAESRASLVYDRAGTGWSDRVRLPRTSRAVTDELHELLTTTAPGPVLLVGHSLGGLYARHYGMRFPEATAGLVLLDPAHEDYDAAMPAELTEMRSGNRFYDLLNVVVGLALMTAPTKALLQMLPALRRFQDVYRTLFEQELTDWPADIRGALVERHTSLDWLAVGLQESRKVDDLYAEVRAAGPMPDVPLIILSSTGSDGFREAVSSGESADLLNAEAQAKLRLYTDVASALPHGEVRVVDSGHVTLPFRQPEAVLAAIEDLTS
jgi:pimeloyl-ACP methyl ester carboxylesterase